VRALIQKAGTKPSKSNAQKIQTATVAVAIGVRNFEASCHKLTPSLPLSSGGLSSDAHNVALLLPSGLEPGLRLQCYGQDAIELEARLCIAFANEILNELRMHIRARTTFIAYKIANLRGVKDNTRAFESMRLLQARIDGTANDYRECRAALFSLRGPGDWVLQSSRSRASFGLPSTSLTSGTLPVAPSAAPIGPSDRGPAYGLLSGPPTLYTHQPPALQPATSTSHLVTLSLCRARYSLGWTSPRLCLGHPM
jgi:hypothetical protein